MRTVPTGFPSNPGAYGSTGNEKGEGLKKGLSSMNKPLLGERRKQVLKALHGEPTQILTQELLASEAFWREAVKNTDPLSSKRCALCQAAVHYQGDSLVLNHRTDCAYVLAQETE